MRKKRGKVPGLMSDMHMHTHTHPHVRIKMSTEYFFRRRTWALAPVCLGPSPALPGSTCSWSLPRCPWHLAPECSSLASKCQHCNPVLTIEVHGALPQGGWKCPGIDPAPPPSQKPSTSGFRHWGTNIPVPLPLRKALKGKHLS